MKHANPPQNKIFWSTCPPRRTWEEIQKNPIKLNATIRGNIVSFPSPPSLPKKKKNKPRQEEGEKKTTGKEKDMCLYIIG